MSIKFEGGFSTGVSLTVSETRTVIVTEEAIAPTTGYKGDPVVYTATILDSTGAKLPATFAIALRLNGEQPYGDVLSEAVYNQETGLLTLPFNIPDVAGDMHIDLAWDEQEI